MPHNSRIRFLWCSCHHHRRPCRHWSAAFQRV
ncbi:SWIM zinc finger family protein [Microbulbifer sp. 2304DJ12-6]